MTGATSVVDERLCDGGHGVGPRLAITLLEAISLAMEARANNISNSNNEERGLSRKPQNGMMLDSLEHHTPRTTVHAPLRLKR